MKKLLFASISFLTVFGIAGNAPHISKDCSKSKGIKACSEALSSLANAGLARDTLSISVFGKTAALALKNKTFSKPIAVKVDTLLWEACPKKERAECAEKCAARTDSSFSRIDAPDSAACAVKPMKLVAKKVLVHKPSPMTLFIDSLALNGFLNSSFELSPAWYSALHAINAVIPVTDSLYPTIALAEKTLIGMDANDFVSAKKKFQYCSIFGDTLNLFLDSLNASFRCPVIGSVVDPRDGKSYRVERFGEKIWMIDNLDFNVPENSACYDADSANCEKYGRLYSFEAAKTACPEGFHAATDADFEELFASFAADFSVSTKFGGYFNQNGISTTVGEGAYFWSTNEDDATRGFARSFFAGESEFSKISVDKKFGLSVRCVQE